MKYTAREGGSGLKDAANETLKDQMNAIKQRLGETGLHIALDMKHDLPNEWHLLKNNGAADLIVDKSRLPYMAQSLNAQIENVMFIAKVQNPDSFTVNIDGTSLSLALNSELNLHKGISSDIKIDKSFSFTVDPADLAVLDGLLLVIKFSF